jgi:hypothetical protein
MAQFVGVKAHTILLLDAGSESQKVWTSLTSFEDAVDYIINLFEDQLALMNSGERSIQVY